MSKTLTLSDLDFTDLYVSANRCWYKHAHHGGEVNDVTDEFKKVMDDLFQLCVKSEEHYESNDFALTVEGLRYRAARMEALFDVYYVLRRFPESVPNISELGYSAPVLKRFLQPDLKGMVVFAGATGSGKTTSASALLLERLRRYGGVGVAIEDPPEMPLEGSGEGWTCFQVPVKGGEFAKPCREMLRWAPNYILLGEVRDSKTALEAIRAGINGHLVICTVHADTVQSAVERFYALASSETNAEDAASQLSNAAAAFIHQTIEKKPNLMLVPRVLFCRGDEGMAPTSNIRKRQFAMLEADIQRQERAMLHERKSI